MNVVGLGFGDVEINNPKINYGKSCPISIQ